MVVPVETTLCLMSPCLIFLPNRGSVDGQRESGTAALLHADVEVHRRLQRRRTAEGEEEEKAKEIQFTVKDIWQEKQAAAGVHYLRW